MHECRDCSEDHLAEAELLRESLERVRGELADSDMAGYKRGFEEGRAWYRREFEQSQAELSRMTQELTDLHKAYAESIEARTK